MNVEIMVNFMGILGELVNFGGANKNMKN